MATPTESELVLGAKNGDSAAFTALVHRYYGLALAHAEAIVRDYQLAQDATQEAFEQAYLGLHTLCDEASFGAWLRGIVRHRCLRRFRQRDLPVLHELEAHEDTVPAWGSAPRLPSEVGEARELLMRAIASLPDSERHVVTMFHLMDCSQREVAAFLGLPVSTVNNRLHQARQRLKDWRCNMTTIHSSSPSEPTLNVGTIVDIRGPVVDVRFHSEASLDVFDAIAVVGEDNLPVERMKVSHRMGDGRVVCLLTSSNAARLSVGMSVLNSRQCGIGLTPFAPMPSVAAEDIVKASRRLSPVREGAPQRLLETGIKAVDLLCPIVADGSLVQVGVAEVGRMALLDELAHFLKGTSHGLNVFGMVSPSEPANYRGWPREVGLAERMGKLRTYWAVATGGTNPQFPALAAFDTVHYCCVVLAVQGLYPALDPEYSNSQWLVQPVASQRHVEVAARAREALCEVKRMFLPPQALELWAVGAPEAAREAVRAYQADSTRDLPPRQLRARQLQLYLTQPFWSASQITGWAGTTVPLSRTLSDCEAILNGQVEQLPLQAFPYAGTLEDVAERARRGDFRSLV